MDYLDVEKAKEKYLSTWQHCGTVIAVNYYLMCCRCGDRFPWLATLGEAVEMAIESEWLKENQNATNTRIKKSNDYRNENSDRTGSESWHEVHAGDY